jgi:PAS domain-containing protein
MSLEVFSGTSIPRELTTAAMEFLWAKWKTLHATGDLTLQRLTEESSFPLREHLVFLMTTGDDFVYTYVGEAVKKAIGRDRAGLLLSASGNPMSCEYAQVYRKVADSLIPACLRYTLPTTQNGKIWQRLVLPVPIAEAAVCIVVYSELIDHHREVYDQLFKTAPDAMVVACPIANDVGHTKDGWVIMMNDRAREMLNFTGSIGNLRLSQVPQFARIDVWGRLYGPKAAQGTVPISTPDFDIELMRFPHVFGLKLRPRVPERIIEHVTLAPALG